MNKRSSLFIVAVSDGERKFCKSDGWSIS